MSLTPPAATAAAPPPTTAASLLALLVLVLLQTECLEEALHPLRVLLVLIRPAVLPRN